MYLYSAAPANTTPVLPGIQHAGPPGASEASVISPSAATNGLLVIKRVSGSGTFSLASDQLQEPDDIAFPTIRPRRRQDSRAFVFADRHATDWVVTFAVGSGTGADQHGTELSHGGRAP